MKDNRKIRPRDRDAVIQSLRAGVVPRRGIQHIQVGRAQEIQALLADVEQVIDGGSSIRFIIGEYGSGKTFFLNLVKSIALEKKCVTLHADLTPDRRLHASGGQARLLFSELMNNMATKAKPDGGAITSVVERFISESLNKARIQQKDPESVIHESLECLKEMVGGYDFAEVLCAYWRGHDSGDEQLKSDAIRWLKGEFATKTDSRKALKVRTIIDDTNFYEMLKLLARFVTLAGYSGLFVSLDEMVNLYKLTNAQARKSNYEAILHILNDTLQGATENLGFLLGGTPEFLYDPRRGLHSYEALASRLVENSFAKKGFVDLSGPIISLANLSKEEVFVLLQNIRKVYAFGDADRYLVDDSVIHAFMRYCDNRIGECYFKTPRNTVTQFVQFLSVLEQNSQASWRDLLENIDITRDEEGGGVPLENEDELAGFRL